MHSMLMPLRRYAEFDGRSRRKEYWMFALFNVMLACVVWLLLGLLYALGMSETAMMTIMMPVVILYGLVGLALVIPGLAGLHDTDRSGWSILWGLVPLVGAIVLLVFYVSEGTSGPNRFGPDPKAGEGGGAMPA